MKKTLKIVLISVGALIGLFLLAAILIPIFYKDEINQAIQKAINEQINATVRYEPNSLSISLLSDFPNLSVSLEGISIVGVGIFEKDTLLNLKKISLGINLASVLLGNKIQIKKIFLEEPYVKALVTKDGIANYNIAKIDTSQLSSEEKPSESAPISIQIEKWKIENGNVIYNDSATATYAQIWGVNHRGSGDFSDKIFDLKTDMRADSMLVIQNQITYLKKASIDIEMTLGMNLEKMLFQFKNNSFRINDLGLKFDGWLQMPQEGYEMDITFQSIDNKFSSLLSMIPGVYIRDLKNLKTNGTFSLDGFVKGKYSDSLQLIPGFLVNLKINDGMFQYQDLPTAIQNIGLDMTLDVSRGNLSDLLVDIKNFNANLGENPLQAKLRLKGLETMQVDADINAQLNLADVMTMYPLPSVRSLRGLYSLNLKVNGIYSEKEKKLPRIQANMKLSQGAVQPADYPVPVENMEIVASVTNTTGNLNETYIEIPMAKMVVNGEPFQASAKIHNLEDITYEAKLAGKMDLELVQKLAPIEGVLLSGKLFADITTKGKMSDINAGKYDRLPTSGKFELTNFSYSDKTYLPLGMKISQAKMSFTPSSVQLETLVGNIGKNDFVLNGQLSNYIAFILSEKAILKGNLNYRGSYFNVNDFMPKTDTVSSPTSASSASSKRADSVNASIAIPKNIDFRFDANIQKVIYGNLELENLTGDVIIKDGIISMNNLNFRSLGGSFSFNGTFNGQNPAKPSYSMNLDIKDVSCDKAYANFATIKLFAPITQNIRGLLSTNLNISGVMQSDFSPNMQSVTGTVLFNLREGQIQDVQALNMLGNQLGMQSLVNPRISDVKAFGEVRDGRMFFRPFDVKIGDYKTVVSGSTGFDGTIDYSITIRDVPIGMLAASYLGPLAAFLGDRRVDIPVSVKGTYDKPIVAPGTPIGAGSSDLRQQTQQGAKDAIRQFAEGVKTDTSSKPVDQKVIEQGKKIIEGFFPRKP
ncbi:MAG: AsmA family protein [Cytophagales bacterium]|nr:AsmA family protein [Cytophagales bacterium]MDW8384743.1 AsmA-like C-terminal region-containing protein [Flammeovirgaceae bacterium]